MGGVLGDAWAWAWETFGGCDLGDKRRTRRLVDMASRLAVHKGKPILRACGGDGPAIEGAYRWVRNREVDPVSISDGAFEATARKARESELVVVPEDTME